jgi:O-antigen/teichoic acid export membrane protein
VRKRLASVWSRTQEAGSIATLVRGASTALFTQALSVGVTYGTQVFLARGMGAAAYGVYEYVGTVGILLGFLSGMGLSSAVLRFVPQYRVRQDWSLLRGIIWGSWGQTVLVSFLVAAVGTGLILRFYESDRTALLLGMASVPLLAIMRLQLEMARGLQRIALAYMPTLLLYPVLMLVAAIGWVQWQGKLTSVSAIALSLGTLALVLLVQGWLCYRGLPLEIKRASPTFEFRQWFWVALPLLFIDGSYLILNQTDTLMIGSFLGSEEVGIYNAAVKTAGWVGFILVAVNAIAAPMFSALYAQGERAELQRLVSTIARWIFYPALLVALVLALFAEPVLALFGAEFVAAKWALIALMMGQLVNVGAGSVGYLLMMTGHHQQCARVVGCSAVLNVVLNWVGIPMFGILGAAIATAISMAVWNIWLYRLVVKYLGINPSIVGALGINLR